MIDRTLQPPIITIDKLQIPFPERELMTNGTPLTIIRAGEQEVVRLDLLFFGGKWRQTKVLQALFASRMLREGTAQYTSKQLAEQLDYYGAWLELSCSMECSYVTLYSLNKYFDQTLAILESIVKEPLFPEDELKTVVDINRQQFLVNSAKVDFTAQKALLQLTFGSSHPCGKYANLEDYDGVTSQLLREYYRDNYHSANCSVFIAGRVTPQIIASIHQTFGAEPFGQGVSKLSVEKYALPESTIGQHFIERPDAMQSSIKLGSLMMTRSHPDYLNMRVLLTLFGGYFGSRLMSNIREEKGYTYGISAGLAIYPDTGVFMISTEAAHEYVTPIIKEVYHEMNVLKNETVGEEELQMVKNYMLGDTCRSYEGPFSLSDSWMFILTTGLADNYFQQSFDAIQNVTAEELRVLAQRHFPTEGMLEVIAGKNR